VKIKKVPFRMPQNHRRVEVDRDLWGSSGPKALLRPDHLELIAQDHARQLLNISKDGDSAACLGNLRQCSVTFTIKECFLMFRRNLLCFSLCLLPYNYDYPSQPLVFDLLKNNCRTR